MQMCSCQVCSDEIGIHEIHSRQIGVREIKLLYSMPYAPLLVKLGTTLDSIVMRFVGHIFLQMLLV
jgi:hypothetical protein